MTLDQRSIDARIAKLRELTKTLKRLQGQYTRKQFFSEDLIRRYIERYLQLSLEAVLDIADHIIAQEGYKKPEDYRQSILILGEEKVLPKEFAKKFAPATGFRNILVHDYLRLDPKKVFQHFQNDAGDIEKFLRHIVKFVESK